MIDHRFLNRLLASRVRPPRKAKALLSAPFRLNRMRSNMGTKMSNPSDQSARSRGALENNNSFPFLRIMTTMQLLAGWYQTTMVGGRTSYLDWTRFFLSARDSFEKEQRHRCCSRRTLLANALQHCLWQIRTQERQGIQIRTCFVGCSQARPRLRAPVNRGNVSLLEARLRWTYQTRQDQAKVQLNDHLMSVGLRPRGANIFTLGSAKTLSKIPTDTVIKLSIQQMRPTASTVPGQARVQWQDILTID